MARQKLKPTYSYPGAKLVEFTALQLAEAHYLKQGQGEVTPAPAVGQPRSGMLGNQAYMNSLVSAQLTCLPALAPLLVGVLGDLDPQKISGVSHSNGDNKWNIAGGSLADQIRVSQAIGGQQQALGFPLTGVLDGAEPERVSQALQPLREQIGPERLQNLLKNVHIQTYLGEVQSGPSAGMGGLGGGGQVAIARDALLDPEKARDYLGHEIGHLVDEEMGRKFGVLLLSDHPVSPFGKGEVGDFRSDYARRNRMEDFAETHTDLMLNWRLYKQFPELGMLARGKYGEKLTFIAQNCYDWTFAAPRPHLVKMAEDVRSGQSPLGYRNAAGELVEADKTLQRILKTLQAHTGPGGVLDEEKVFAVSRPEQTRRRWVLDALRQQPGETRQAVSVQETARDIQRAASLIKGDPEKPRLGGSVLRALEMGGPIFAAQCGEQLGDAPEVRKYLDSMTTVAGTTWQPGTF